jgi:hypothetical protein
MWKGIFEIFRIFVVIVPKISTPCLGFGINIKKKWKKFYDLMRNLLLAAQNLSCAQRKIEVGLCVNMQKRKKNCYTKNEFPLFIYFCRNLEKLFLDE